MKTISKAKTHTERKTKEREQFRLTRKEKKELSLNRLVRCPQHLEGRGKGRLREYG